MILGLQGRFAAQLISARLDFGEVTVKPHPFFPPSLDPGSPDPQDWVGRCPCPACGFSSAFAGAGTCSSGDGPFEFVGASRKAYRPTHPYDQRQKRAIPGPQPSPLGDRTPHTAAPDVPSVNAVKSLCEQEDVEPQISRPGLIRAKLQNISQTRDEATEPIEVESSAVFPNDDRRDRFKVFEESVELGDNGVTLSVISVEA